MDLPAVPVRIAAISGMMHELLAFEIPGIVFLAIWGSDQESPVRKLLETPLLGYTTKLLLLAAVGFMAGFFL